MKKILMYVANRIWLILAIYIASVLAGAATFGLLEGKDFGDGVWWATVTALTIGYGDLTPVTPAGRAATMLFGHFWIFVIIPMIIANIIMHLVEDKHLFTDEEQNEMMQRLRKVEALLSDDYAIPRRDDGGRRKSQLSQPLTPPNSSIEQTFGGLRP
jgi:hypothetical protein